MNECFGCNNRCVMTSICKYPEKSGRCKANLSVSEILEMKQLLRINCLLTTLMGQTTDDECYGYGRWLCNGCDQRCLCGIEELVLNRIREKSTSYYERRNDL